MMLSASNKEHLQPERIRVARRNAADSDRPPRARAAAGGRRGWLIAACATAAVVMLAAGGYYLAGLRGGAPHGVARPAIAESSASASAAMTASVAPTANLVEIPDLSGANLEEASLVLKAAGLVGCLSTGQPLKADAAGTIASQDPPAGKLAGAGSTVTLTLAENPADNAKRLKRPGASNSPYVVCIDPGHQAHSDPVQEPIGPGAPQLRPRATTGASGVQTSIPEYEIVLQIATNLQKRLEAAGVTVVMTRTTNDVNIANSARAAIANDAKADLFVRIHADSNPDSALCGVATKYPAANAWTQPIAGPSKEAARLLQTNAVSATGAVDRGALERADLVGFNYAKVPSVLVETGFLSNRVEDKLLASPHYQDQLAQGISQGILTYLKGTR